VWENGGVVIVLLYYLNRYNIKYVKGNEAETQERRTLLSVSISKVGWVLVFAVLRR
jgi:hypothetical protein